MRHKIGYLLILFLLATAIATWSAEPKQKQVVRGTIEKIDPSAKKLTIKKEKKADLMEFVFAEDIYVWTQGKRLTLSDLKVGEVVSVYYDTATNQANKIFVPQKG